MAAPVLPVYFNDIPSNCLNQAAVAEHVSVPLLLSILKIENGRNGMANLNKNGTYDYGPMQINSRWIKILRLQGISAYDLQFNPCKNVLAGAWILHQNMEEDPNLWSSVGDYHSHTPNLNEGYSVKVYHQLRHMIAALNSNHESNN